MDIFIVQILKLWIKSLWVKDDNAETLLVYEQNKEKDKNYDNPVNIFKGLVFSWTRKVLSTANSKPQLEI